MVSDQTKAILRAFIKTFPSLKYVLIINDCVTYILYKLYTCLKWTIGSIFRLVYDSINAIVRPIINLFPSINLNKGAKYERLGKRAISSEQQDELSHYEDDPFKRFLTYPGALILGFLLYVFVYFVLIKHHNFTSVTVAFVLMLPYLLVLDNSHSIRSILMLCLPIMFTNRGRALVFCCMLSIMASGPLRNSQLNINEIHSSLNCTKQYMIIRTDEFVEKNVIKSLLRVEDIIYSLVDRIKAFSNEIKEKIRVIIQLAITVDQYIKKAIEELKKIVDICNVHSEDIIINCKRRVNRSYSDCRIRLRRYGLVILCELIKTPGRGICDLINTPGQLCAISKKIVDYLDKKIRERLMIIMQIIENELYVDVDIHRTYSYNGTKSKSFKKVFKEIKFDVVQKFWYIHFITRVFNLVSLILVIWITLTATLYHMHYLTELNYDNMYIDGYLKEIENRREEKKGRKKINSNDFIFPLTNKHQRQYLKPFSLWMNEVERHKVYVAGFVWLIIVGYIFLFVALDYGLFRLIELVDEILKDILFRSDLPLIDVTSKSGSQIIHYNRTYLSQLRQNYRSSRLSNPELNRTKGFSGMYRNLMDSIESNIPDDVMILDSLQQCLPEARVPDFRTYERLAYLALFTFCCCIIEAYALRTRHCIANVYYPNRARRRSLWLYQKILAEKPKYDMDQGTDFVTKDKKPSPWLAAGLKILEQRVKR